MISQHPNQHAKKKKRHNFHIDKMQIFAFLALAGPPKGYGSENGGALIPINVYQVCGVQIHYVQSNQPLFLVQLMGSIICIDFYDF